jgi:hypothetical protein
MKREWNQVEINGQIVVPFEWRDNTPGGGNLGRAEFRVCLKFKKGMTCEFWVYPVQTHLTDCWHWVGNYYDFTVNAYHGLKSEGAWLFYYCKEHKCISFNVYAPPESKFVSIDNNGLTFLKSDWSSK